jgi:hypothetical protein
MRTILLRNLSPAGVFQVGQALDLLWWAAPDHHFHIHSEIAVISYGPDACGQNAIACTNGPYGRQIVLTTPPEQTAVVELAIILSHEARHHFTDRYGHHHSVPHRCVDCGAPAERAMDPIYVDDEHLRQRLLQALQPPPQPLGWPPPLYYQGWSQPLQSHPSPLHPQSVASLISPAPLQDPTPWITAVALALIVAGASR